MEQTKQEVIDLMKSSKNAQEWNSNCDKVKKAYGGYPDWWYKEIIMNEVINESQINNGWKYR